MKDTKKKPDSGIQILAPINGKVIPLEQVPDPVFAEKIIGDGVAIQPSDGKIYSPVDGEITTVADTLHAYGFRTEDGIELLIHFGLETVALKGECFKAHVKAGDKVKAGQLIAEADMAYLKKREINPVTPILVCGGNDGMELQGHMGQVVHGKNAVITLKKSQEKEAVKEVKKAEVKETKTEELQATAVVIATVRSA